MKTSSFKLMVLTCITLSLVACGKNKDDSAPVSDARAGGQPPASPAPATPAQADSAETPPPNKADAEGEAGDTPGTVEAPSAPAPKAEADIPENNEIDGHGDGNTAQAPVATGEQAPLPPDHKPVQTTQPATLPKVQPNQAQPKEAQTKAQNGAPAPSVAVAQLTNIICSGKDLTPDEKAEMNRLIGYARNFTGTGNDYVRTFLRDKANSQCNLNNLRAAHAIQAAYLEFTYPDAGFGLTLIMNLKGSLKVVKVFGDLREDRKANFVAPAGRFNTTGIAIKGTVECLDVEPNRQGLVGCETATVSLAMGSQVKKAVVDIIVRRSYFNIEAQFAQQDRRTQTEVEFRDYLGQRSVLKEDYVRKSLLQTFEVMNGRSGFKGKLVSNKNEILVLTGPLTHNNSNISEVQFGAPAMLSEDYKFENQNVRESFYARNLILGAELLENDGRGTFAVRIELPKKSQGPDYADLFIHLDTQGVGLIQE